MKIYIYPLICSLISIISIASTADDTPATAINDEYYAPPALRKAREEYTRANSNNGCSWGGRPEAKWHPVYAAGWTNGYCRFTIDCDSPGYSTELSCCKNAYAGQMYGYCIIMLPSPPTISPTETGKPKHAQCSII